MGVLFRGKTRKQEKAARKRREGKVTQIVREDCARRDGYCRLAFLPSCVAEAFGKCDGPSEWAHMTERRRSRTVNKDPEFRHAAEHSLMLCKHHHGLYDTSQLFIEKVDAVLGARGRLRYLRPDGRHVYEEVEA